MRVRYTRPAAAELAKVLAYVAERSPQGARTVGARIKAIETLLALFPEAGEPTRLPWLRRIATPPLPYLIFYEVTPAEVIIHRVRHAARKPAT